MHAAAAERTRADVTDANASGSTQEPAQEISERAADAFEATSEKSAAQSGSPRLISSKPAAGSSSSADTLS